MVATTLSEAYMFAYGAHAGAGQKRKYSGAPYVTHTARVATMVAKHGGTHAMISAAYLHDVLEDTQVTEADLRELFPDYVVDLVVDLTNVSKASGANREERKRMDRERLAKVSVPAKTIKLADIFDNVTSILVEDPAFALKYCQEKRELLPVLKEGNATLFKMVEDLLESAPK